MITTRSTCLLLVACTILPTSAQITDPGFETGAGWQSTCFGAVSYSSDVPLFGGNLSGNIAMLSSTAPPCYTVDGIEPMLYQELTGLQNGDTVWVHAWVKATPDTPANQPWMMGLIVQGWMTSATTYSYDFGNIWSFYSFQASGQWQLVSLQCVLSGVPSGSTPALLLGGHAVNNTNGIIHFDNVQIHVLGTGAKLSSKVWLDGCYVQSQNLMRDDLRTAGLIPATEPYTAMYGGSGGETVAPSVLAVSGNNAIVDWVRLELHSGGPGWPSPVAARNVLLQRDGDVVDLDGVSPVTFNVARGNYWVVVRHRNHLGAMSAALLGLSGTTTVFDLRSPSTACLVLPAPNTDIPRKSIGTTRALWAGNAHPYWGKLLKYTGTGNDRDAVLSAIGGTVPTNTVPGYNIADVNLDGVVKYTGVNNDRDVILLNIGGIIPTNTRIEQVP